MRSIAVALAITGLCGVRDAGAHWIGTAYQPFDLGLVFWVSLMAATLASMIPTPPEVRKE